MAERKTGKKKTEAAAEKIATVPETEQKVQTEQPAEEEKLTISKAELDAMIAAAVRSAMAGMAPAKAEAAPAKERILLLWQAPVANENVRDFGPDGRYGRIVGPTGQLYVSKDDFNQILDAMTRRDLDRRWLIVVSGMDEDEREAYGVNYKAGEILTQQAFLKLAEQGEKLTEIYPKLCEGHRRVVATLLYDAYKHGNKHVNRGLVVKLNKLARRIDPEESAFRTILAEMNAEEEADEDE